MYVCGRMCVRRWEGERERAREQGKATKMRRKLSGHFSEPMNRAVQLYLWVGVGWARPDGPDARLSGCPARAEDKT